MDSYGDYILSTKGDRRMREAIQPVLLRVAVRELRHDCESRFRPLRVYAAGARQDLIAIDSAPTVVEKCQSEEIDIRLGSASEMPFADGTIEALYSCWLLEHLDDPAAAMIEIARVLRPGKYVCLIVKSEESLRRGFHHDYTHVRPFTAASMPKLSNVARFSRSRPNYLLWTRGLRRLIPVLGEDRMMKVLELSEIALRRTHTVNRFNLVFEGWK